MKSSIANTYKPQTINIKGIVDVVFNQFLPVLWWIRVEKVCVYYSALWPALDMDTWDIL